MDTISHMTLGAAVGEAILGKKVGNKAILWGAVAGTLPDLDLLAAPFLDPVSRLTFHRGLSHSIPFIMILAPVLGFLLYRLYGKHQASWKAWSWFSLWTVLSHPILDSFTPFGTQLFWPFSSYRVAVSSISIVDPIYTGPLFLSVLIVLFLKRAHPYRRVVLYTGMAVSTLYLFSTLITKTYVDHKIEASLQKQHISYGRFISTPTPLNTILWRAVAEDEEVYWVGYYSLLDKSNFIKFTPVRKNHSIIRTLMKEEGVQKLIYLSKDYYCITEKNGDVYFNDMRYGQIDGWMNFTDEFIFSYQIVRASDSPNPEVRVLRKRPAIPLNSKFFQTFLNRVLGM